MNNRLYPKHLIKHLPVGKALKDLEDLSKVGVKYDKEKARYDLMPPEPIEELALLYAKGAIKYAERNWELGLSRTRCFAALMRHAWSWMRGEDIDPETGIHHMIAVAWNAFAIFTYHVRNIGLDDRPSKKVVVRNAE